MKNPILDAGGDVPSSLEELVLEAALEEAGIEGARVFLSPANPMKVAFSVFCRSWCARVSEENVDVAVEKALQLWKQYVENRKLNVMACAVSIPV